MDNDKKEIIAAKIAEVLALAEENQSPMLVLYAADDEPGGLMLSAFGPEKDVVKMIVKATSCNAVLKRIMRLACTHLFTQKPQELTRFN